ncbi:hypothetical protein E0H36_08465 [Rhizobium leguminosarum bv. viciae]|uniref:hypothetical protein n=1 Tax=Rhizobium leguminosarum TaxID=384 RepID=UPI0010405CE6|nr:hypothetical protein [Rhizobium leguminosarum]MBY5484413.1 hypothetical protein [Rhizobium leguminosarum]TBZ34472.1 hypothetical protein E0H36_08465 [Rhizobium leguminosarum bv. viciae]
MMKPFSAYPEDRAKLLELAATVLKDEDASKEACILADLVKAILEDEQWGLDRGVWKAGDFAN